MKPFFKVAGIGLVLVIAGVIGVTTYQFNTYTPSSISQAVNPDNLSYFQESYGDCRKAFIDAAESLKVILSGVRVASLKIESRTDPDLTVDYCYIPAQLASKRLMIITSGVHGIEGYAGSAVQQMILRDLVKHSNMDELGLLLIHGVNPYGFKSQRRVTEKNVDLNRNCTTDIRLFDTVNKGYNDLNTWLNPKQKVNLTSFDHFFFQINTVRRIIKYSMGTLRQAILQGQYQYEKGIYFGGRTPDAAIKAVTPLVQQVAANYEMVLGIDVHTGYGANGTLHLLSNPIKDEKKKAMMEQIFTGAAIDWGDEENFYSVTGDIATYLGEILPETAYLSMAFEFGTLDTQTTMGSIKALHNVIIENQGVQHGYKSEKDEIKVKSRYLESYYPSSRAWRSKAIEDARQTLVQAIKKYQETDLPE